MTLFIFSILYMTITDMLISCKALQCFAPHQLCQQVYIGKKKSRYSNNSSIMFVLILSRIQIHTYLFSQRRLVTLPMFIVQGGCKEMLWLKIRQSKLVSELEGFPLTDGIHVFWPLPLWLTIMLHTNNTFAPPVIRHFLVEYIHWWPNVEASMGFK